MVLAKSMFFLNKRSFFRVRRETGEGPLLLSTSTALDRVA